jgi:ketosteroid isomerase-like protein
VACAEAYTEDALILVSKVAPIRGKKEIAAAFAAAMEAGQEIFGLTTMTSEADEGIGYAIQTVHSNRGDGTVMLALRCDEDGLWRICVEAVIGE